MSTADSEHELQYEEDSVIARLNRDLEEARAIARRLRDTLDRAEDYLDHGASCIADCKDAGGDPFPCTCGLDHEIRGLIGDVFAACDALPWAHE